ncbi:MAG: CBS domain-containing protein [Ahrensia sp.]|nr:CBS domain-containing protein [Ahrensia sp.]
MSVQEILAVKGNNVVTASADDSVADVAAMLAENKIGALVVIEGDAVTGIASERDLIRAVHKNGAAALAEPVRNFMTSKVVSCKPSDTIDQLMEMMTAGRFRHLPVLDDGKLVGIVSIGDVVKRKIEQAERDAEDLKRYIAG